MNDLGRDPSAGCPDAETLAAWSDEGLQDDERVQVEAHVADCARCQMQLATMIRMAPRETAAAAPARRFHAWRWLVPVTGAVAAAGLWVLVQPSPMPVPAPPQQLQVQAPAEPATPEASRDRVDERASQQPPAREVDRKFEELAEKAPRKEQLADKRQLDLSAREELESRRALGNSAPPPPPAAAAASPPQAFGGRVARLAKATDALDLSALRVQRSPDGRVTWDQAEGLSAQVTAGASPTPSVIWLVGKQGLVLLSTDGKTFRRLPFPDTRDLTAVQATSDFAATVTAADGRTFATSDAGTTWLPR